MWFSKHFGLENEEDDHREIVEKLSALYGEDWKEKSDDLMDAKYFKEIPEFLLSKEKILTTDKVRLNILYHFIKSLLFCLRG